MARNLTREQKDQVYDYVNKLEREGRALEDIKGAFAAWFNSNEKIGFRNYANEYLTTFLPASKTAEKMGFSKNDPAKAYNEWRAGDKATPFGDYARTWLKNFGARSGGVVEETRPEDRQSSGGVVEEEPLVYQGKTGKKQNVEPTIEQISAGQESPDTPPQVTKNFSIDDITKPMKVAGGILEDELRGSGFVPYVDPSLLTDVSKKVQPVAPTTDISVGTGIGTPTIPKSPASLILSALTLPPPVIPESSTAASILAQGKQEPLVYQDKTGKKQNVEPTIEQISAGQESPSILVNAADVKSASIPEPGEGILDSEAANRLESPESKPGPRVAQSAAPTTTPVSELDFENLIGLDPAARRDKIAQTYKANRNYTQDQYTSAVQSLVNRYGRIPTGEEISFEIGKGLSELLPAADRGVLNGETAGDVALDTGGVLSGVSGTVDLTEVGGELGQAAPEEKDYVANLEDEAGLYSSDQVAALDKSISDLMDKKYTAVTPEEQAAWDKSMAANQELRNMEIEKQFNKSFTDISRMSALRGTDISSMKSDMLARLAGIKAESSIRLNAEMEQLNLSFQRGEYDKMTQERQADLAELESKARMKGLDSQAILSANQRNVDRMNTLKQQFINDKGNFNKYMASVAVESLFKNADMTQQWNINLMNTLTQMNIAGSELQLKADVANMEDDRVRDMSFSEDKRSREIAGAEMLSRGQAAEMEDNRIRDLAYSEDKRTRALAALEIGQRGNLALLDDERVRDLAYADDKQVRDLARAEIDARSNLAELEDDRIRDLALSENIQERDMAIAELDNRNKLAVLDDNRLRDLANDENLRIRDIATLELAQRGQLALIDDDRLRDIANIEDSRAGTIAALELAQRGQLAVIDDERLRDLAQAELDAGTLQATLEAETKIAIAEKGYEVQEYVAKVGAISGAFSGIASLITMATVGAPVA